MVTLAAVVITAVVGLIGYWLGRRSGWASAMPTAAMAAAELDEAEERHRKPRLDVERALDDLQIGVVVVDASGAEIYRNHQALQYATGRHGDALVEAAIERVVGGALVGLSVEESVEVFGPPARVLQVQASPTYDDGEISGAVGVIDDVTEARHLDRVRADFVANVSHELRTPVGAMSVLAETIATADDPETIDRLADRIQREASRLSNTIDDLLTLSRLESGTIADPETIDLASVARMAIERTETAATKRGVRVSLDDTVGQPVLVDGDRGQLVSAAANLIDNAIKYSDPGGEVAVRVAAATADAADRGDAVDLAGAGAGADGPRGPTAELTVQDAGIGIPDRDLDRIFERFYRVDSARRRETGGTGLGLSIVRHALLNHRGTIEVASTEGQGSTFTMRLPRSPAVAAESQTRSSPWTT